MMFNFEGLCAITVTNNIIVYPTDRMSVYLLKGKAGQYECVYTVRTVRKIREDKYML